MGFGAAGFVPFLDRRRDPGQRPWRRPGGRSSADGPPLTTRQDRRVLRDLRARRQGQPGHRHRAVRRILLLLFDSLGNGAYQVAVLSLLVTMLIGLWLVWPVRDDWAGSGEVRRRRPTSATAGRRTDWRRARPRWSRASVALSPGSRSGGAGATPRPSRRSHRARSLRPPSRGRRGSIVARDEDRRVAGPPLAHRERDRSPDDALRPRRAPRGR